MINVYIANTEFLYQEEKFKEYCDKVDQVRLSKVLRTEAYESQVRSLLAGYLLQHGMRSRLGINKEEVLNLQYEYREEDKPYLKNYPTIFLNISHSGSYVACAVADQEVGVDIQQIKPAKCAMIAERFFTKKEADNVKEQVIVKEQEELFYTYWAIKESYIKLTGKGLKQGLDTFWCDYISGEIKDAKSWKTNAFFSEQLLDSNYCLAVCSYEKSEYGIEEICL